MNPQQQVAVALSGGGVRAFLFGLGALRAVIAACTRELRITDLVGVSGGGLACAFAASRIDVSKTTLAEYDEKVLRPAVQAITRRSMMFGTWQVWGVIFVTLVLLVVAAAVGFHGFGLPWWARAVVALVCLYGAAVVWGWRGVALEQGIRRVLFADNPRLVDVDGDARLVLQTTDLGSGEATYLTSRGISSWRWGEAPTGDLSLVRAARATATFPVVFPALNIAKLNFTDGHEAAPRRLALVDGGVYDNMGSEWLLNPERTPDEAYKIVVNASQNLAVRKSGFGTLGIGEIRVLLRNRDIQYDATTAPRRRWLNTLFANGLERGTLVRIDGNIHTWVSRFTQIGDPRGGRASAVQQSLDAVGDRSVWHRWPEMNSAVMTSLGRVPTATAADLVRAGYLATSIQTHVLEEWPAPDAFDPAALLTWLDG